MSQTDIVTAIGFNPIEQVESIQLDLNKHSSSNRNVENQIADILLEISKQVFKITEFNPRELMAISMLYNHKYIRPYLDIYLANKKHYKRKHSKELLKMIEYISSMISMRMSENDQASTFSRFFKQNSRY